MTATTVQRIDLTPLERKMLRLLGGCTFAPGSFDKRFVRSIGDVTALTEKQRAVFHKLFYRYRRQMGLSDVAAQRIVDQVQGKGVAYPLLEMEEEKEKKETEKPCSNVAI